MQLARKGNHKLKVLTEKYLRIIDGKFYNVLKQILAILDELKT